MAWFGLSDIDLGAALRSLNDNLRSIVTAIDQVRADYKAWGTEVKGQRDTAVAALAAKTTEAEALAKALADFQADDAATDATQLVDQANSIAEGLRSDLDSLKDQPAPVEPEPSGDPIADVPTEDVPDETSPGDVETNEPPADETPAGRKRR